MRSESLIPVAPFGSSMEGCLNCEKRGQTRDSKLCASCWLGIHGPDAQAEEHRGAAL